MEVASPQKTMERLQKTFQEAAGSVLPRATIQGRRKDEAGSAMEAPASQV